MPTFFASSKAFEAWLERHHASASELLVGFFKKASGKPGMSWPESVDQALRFGWIDGVRRNIDEESYVIRFTPRRRGSRWSAVNIRRAAELEAMGLMKPAGIEALEARSEERSATYSYERAEPARLDPALSAALRANGEAARFMETLAPSYRRKIIHWIMSAKRDDVRLRRLNRAMAALEKGERP